MDIEAAGGAATGGLLAGALERPTGHAGDAEGNCTDCGQPVDARFCPNCGQPTHVHRSLLHLGEDHFVERLQSYVELAPALRERVPDIDYVDLRFGERVYVRPVATR